jgi:succinate-semialdehyde dehydrogenase/glutarate-semialdehyde dehydrogenase
MEHPVPIATVNPTTGKTEREFDPLTSSALAERLELTKKAAAQLRGTSIVERTAMLDRLADLLDDAVDTLAEVMTTEMGKTLTSAKAEARKGALGCRYYATNAAAMLASSEHLGDDSWNVWAYAKPGRGEPAVDTYAGTDYAAVIAGGVSVSVLRTDWDETSDPPPGTSIWLGDFAARLGATESSAVSADFGGGPGVVPPRNAGVSSALPPIEE